MLGQAFGLRDYPRIFSLSQALTTLGVAGGPLLIGMVQGVAGYEFAFATVAAASLAALALLIAAGLLPQPDMSQTSRVPS
jgi:predicted MFS family arabinose efflux permease